MKTNKLRIVSIITTLIALITIATSQLGTITSGNQVSFKDGTGYYSEEGFNKSIGEKKLFIGIKIIDLYN